LAIMVAASVGSAEKLVTETALKFTSRSQLARKTFPAAKQPFFVRVPRQYLLLLLGTSLYCTFSNA